MEHEHYMIFTYLCATITCQISMLLLLLLSAGNLMNASGTITLIYYFKMFIFRNTRMWYASILNEDFLMSIIVHFLVKQFRYISFFHFLFLRIIVCMLMYQL